MLFDAALIRLKATAAYIKLGYTAAAQGIVASSQYTLVAAKAATGYFIKILDFSDSAATSESRVSFFGKTIAEARSAADSALKLFAKPFLENRSATDVAVREVNKPLAESRSAIDATAKSLTQAPIQESLSNSDRADVVPNKGLLDNPHQSEGPYAGQIYADPTYFAQDYTLDGLPVFAVSKRVTDAHYATDDFHAHANGDDDETMDFVKVLSELHLSSEQLTSAFARPLADVSATSDARTIQFSRALSDVLAKSDIVVRDVGKLLADATATSETRTYGFSKALSDTGATFESISLALSRVATDFAVSTDSALKNFARGLSDSVGKSDSVVLSADKAPGDAISVAMSAYGRKTDYTDISYFAEDYVGSTFTF